MIQFSGDIICPKCNEKILMGGIVMLPFSKETEHLCLKCAVIRIKEYNETHSRKSNKILFLTDDDTQKDK